MDKLNCNIFLPASDYWKIGVRDVGIDSVILAGRDHLRQGLTAVNHDPENVFDSADETCDLVGDFINRRLGVGRHKRMSLLGSAAAGFEIRYQLDREIRDPTRSADNRRHLFFCHFCFLLLLARPSFRPNVGTPSLPTLSLSVANYLGFVKSKI